MHPRIEHLLSLRDGEPVPVGVREHVAGCASCATVIAEAARLQGGLRALPELPAAPNGWSRLQARLEDRRATAQRRVVAARVAVAASVCVVALAIGWRIADDAKSPAMHVRSVPAPLSAEDAVALDRVAQLRSESQLLDDTLAALGDRPAVERAGTALPIDTLEGQVQWIDHRLSVESGELRPASTEQLWRERVEAMNSLVRLRYVEAQRIAM